MLRVIRLRWQCYCEKNKTVPHTVIPIRLTKTPSVILTSIMWRNTPVRNRDVVVRISPLCNKTFQTFITNLLLIGSNDRHVVLVSMSRSQDFKWRHRQNFFNLKLGIAKVNILFTTRFSHPHTHVGTRCLSKWTQLSHMGYSNMRHFLLIPATAEPTIFKFGNHLGSGSCIPTITFRTKIGGVPKGNDIFIVWRWRFEFSSV